jgi:hypothetical protein
MTAVAAFSEDAEQAVLAALLIEPAALVAVRAILTTPSDFYLSRHAVVYGACLRLHAAGTVVDPLTLADELGRKGELEGAGGKDYIGFLVDAVPTAANVEYHAKIVLERAKQRALDGLLVDTLGHVRDGALTAADVARRMRPALDALAASDDRDALQNYDDVEILALPPLTFLVDGLLPAGGSVCLYGAPGTGKSFVALHAALCVATGRPFFGRAVQRAPVLYAAAEGVAGLPGRVASWKRYHGVDNRAGVRFITEPVNLLDDRSVARLLALAAMDKPGFVVIDTLARSLPGGDENSADIMGRAVGAVARIQRETGASVLLVHHTGKAGEVERGSTALRGAMDVMLPLTGSDGALTIECDSASAKMKDAAKSAAIHLRLLPEGQSCVLVPAKHTLQSDVTTATGSERRLLVSLQRGFLAEGATATEWMKAADVPDRTFYFAKTALVTRGYVTNTHGKRGGRYVLTAEGTRVVAATCNLPAR